MDKERLAEFMGEGAENPHLAEILLEMPDEISRTLNISRAEPGAVLAYAGDPFHSVYMLLSGVIRLSYELNTEFVYTFASVRAVGILGETESFTGHPVYKATIICHTRCSYIAMPASRFLAWMRQDAKSLLQMTRYLVGKYSEQVRQDRILLSASGDNRFLYLLIKYYGLYAENGICRIPESKENMAEEICVSVKTVSRCIGRLKAEDLLTVKGHNLIITRQQYRILSQRFNELV